MRGNLVWEIYAFVPSKAGLIYKRGGPSQGWSLKRGGTIIYMY